MYQLRDHNKALSGDTQTAWSVEYVVYRIDIAVCEDIELGHQAGRVEQLTYT